MLKTTFLTGEYPPMQGGIADYTANLAQHLLPLDIHPSILITHRWQQISQTTTTNPQSPISQSPNLQSPIPNPQSPISSSQSPNLQSPVSNLQSPVSNLQSPISNLQSPNLQSPIPIYPTLPNWGWRCWPSITQFLNQHQPDILHIQYQAAAFDLGGWVNWLPWYLKKRGTHTRLITTFHDLRIPYIFPKAGRFRWRSILALACHSDTVICTNREDLKTLQTELGLSNSQPPLPQSPNLQSPNPQSPIPNLQSPISSLQSPSLTVIPLGTNIEPHPPADFDRNIWRQKYHTDEQSLLLAYFGFLNESKGGEELIEAVRLLRQQDIDARLLFIGGDIGHADPTNVAYAERIQTLIAEYGLSEVVYRTGYVEEAEVSTNLLAADAVVLPYLDGVSFRRTTLIAALRHGCPVVSTTPNDPELIPEIQPGYNMLLAPPGDASGLAQAIAPLHRNDELWQQLSQGSKQLGDLFEWSRIAEETAGVYRGLRR